MDAIIPCDAIWAELMRQTSLLLKGFGKKAETTQLPDLLFCARETFQKYSGGIRASKDVTAQTLATAIILQEKANHVA